MKDEKNKKWTMADETQKLIESFVGKAKAGSRAGNPIEDAAREKPVGRIARRAEKEERVFTLKGIMTKEEAIKKGPEADEMKL